MNRYTIKEVAKRAGVSIKTVSRVFNNEPYVKSSTRKRVLEVAKELQYVPHPQARSLSRGRTQTLGVLYENAHEFGYMQQLLDGVFEACQENDYSFVLRPTTVERAPDATKEFIRETRIEGLVMTAPICDDENLIRILQENDIGFVQISPMETNSRLMSVSADDEAAAIQMMGEIIAMGHRRIGFIKGHPSHGASKKRFAGYCRALQSSGIDIDDALIAQGFFDFESGKAATKQLLSQRSRPTAIFASNDDMAAGAIVSLYMAGLRVPQDVSVTGFDDAHLADRLWPPLTTIRQPTRTIARSAAQRLINQLSGRPSHTLNETFECELVTRSSLSAPSR